MREGAGRAPRGESTDRRPRLRGGRVRRRLRRPAPRPVDPHDPHRGTRVAAGAVTSSTAVTGPGARRGGPGLVDRMRVTSHEPPSTAERRGGIARFVKTGPVLTGWAELAVRPLGPAACELVWTERIGLRGLPTVLTDLGQQARDRAPGRAPSCATPRTTSRRRDPRPLSAAQRIAARRPDPRNGSPPDTQRPGPRRPTRRAS